MPWSNSAGILAKASASSDGASNHRFNRTGKQYENVCKKLSTILSREPVVYNEMDQ